MIENSAAAQFLPSCEGILSVMEGFRQVIGDRGKPDCWLRGEPTLEELLEDPMLLLVLRSSRTSVEEIRRLAGRFAAATTVH